VAFDSVPLLPEDIFDAVAAAAAPASERDVRTPAGVR
jgi:hypothetical protein